MASFQCCRCPAALTICAINLFLLALLLPLLIATVDADEGDPSAATTAAAAAAAAAVFAAAAFAATTRAAGRRLGASKPGTTKIWGCEPVAVDYEHKHR